MAEFSITGKQIGAAVGVFTLLGMLWGVSQYFQPKTEAEEEHDVIVMRQVKGDARLAEYDEVGNLENQIRLTRLEIKQIHLTQERRVLDIDEASELDYLDEKLLILEDRLLDLQRDMKTDG
jgi:hypothetical protein